MRILDESGNEVSNPDLTVGKLELEVVIKDGAKPIDDKTKFAWDDDDYETIQRYIVVPELQRVEDRIAELKAMLEQTDYIAAKSLDLFIGCSSESEMLAEAERIRATYGGRLSDRQEWRDEINALEDRRSILRSEDGN